MEHDSGVDIIVVNYRTPEDLGDFVRSLRDNRPRVEHDTRIFNVSPLAEDTEVAMSFFDCDVVSDERNVGYAAAVNRSVALGNREVIAIFNADVKVTPDSIDECYVALMGNDDWGILGPRQVDSRGKITHAGILGTREHREFRGWHKTSGEEYQDVHDDAPTVMGAAFFVKRACWDDLTACPQYRDHVTTKFPAADYGAFLPTFLFYEELFCCYHAIEHEWKVVYFGTTTMIHEWHRSVRRHLPHPMESTVVNMSREQFRAACEAVHGMPHE